MSCYELTLNAEGLLTEMTWYYFKEVWKNPEDKNSEKGKPRLSISFSGYNKKASLTKEELDESKYFIKKEKKLVLTEKYKRFKLYDERIVMN